MTAVHGRPRVVDTPSITSAELAVLDIGGQSFALPIASVVAVLDPHQMTPALADEELPWVGTLATRTGTIPVADGCIVFDLPSAAPIGRILVLRGEPLFALAVGGLLGTLRPVATDTYRLPALCGAPEELLVDAAIWDSEHLLLRIDPAMLERWLAGPRRPARHASHASDDAWYAPAEMVVSHGSRALLVEVADELCALPVGWVRHISDSPTPVHLPRAHAALAGLVSWERAPIPVVDIARLARQLGNASERGMLVVIGTPADAESPPGQPLGALRVSAVVGVAAVMEWRTDVVLLTDGRCVRPLDMRTLLADISWKRASLE